MFDDPRKNLDRLQQQLLAEEADFDDAWESLGDIPEEEPMPACGEQEPPRPAAREKGIRGLVFLAFLELLGILLISGWWMLWLR